MLASALLKSCSAPVIRPPRKAVLDSVLRWAKGMLRQRPGSRAYSLRALWELVALAGFELAASSL